MKKLFFFIILFSLQQAGLLAQATWTLDDAHSNLQFSLTHLMVSDIEGSVKIRESTLSSPNADFADASVSLTADMSTIDTDNEGRDEHLRSPDFFDVAKYPELIFKSTSFKKISDTKYTVTGNLTFHGITKPVTLDATAGTTIRPYDNKTIVGFRVKSIINRTDFGISVDTPAALLSNEVEVEGNIIFVKG